MTLFLVANNIKNKGIFSLRVLLEGIIHIKIKNKM